jgi:hypothetical protein
MPVWLMGKGQAAAGFSLRFPVLFFLLLTAAKLHRTAEGLQPLQPLLTFNL